MTFTIEVVQVVFGFPEFGHVKFILIYYYGKMSLWKMVTMENDMYMYHYGKCHYGKCHYGKCLYRKRHGATL